MYSSPDHIRSFLGDLPPRTLFVFDIDGNSAIGYKLGKGHHLALPLDDDPKECSIPSHMTPGHIQAMVNDGVLSEELFALKPGDSRLLSGLVELVNDPLACPWLHDIAFLTSRSLTDAQKLLKKSGVQDVNMTTLLADSGATLSTGGKTFNLRPLNEHEYLHLQNLHEVARRVKPSIDDVICKHGHDASTCPDLIVEIKGIAGNIHFRNILEHYGVKDNSPLDDALREVLKNEMYNHALHGPADENCTPVFKLLSGPATVEMKVNDVHKGKGLNYLVDVRIADGRPPAAIVFSGDDVAKADGTPGTDYFAMIEDISGKHGIPHYNIHTQHPADGTLKGTIPSPSLSPANLKSGYRQPNISLTVPSPPALIEIVRQAYGRCEIPDTRYIPEEFDLSSSPKPQ